MTAPFVPTTQSELARYLADNAAGDRQPVQVVGGRTSLGYGYPLADPPKTVSLENLNRIVDYPARDMTITVEVGLRFDELIDKLKEENQRLPIDVPQSHRATLGGVIATNTSGPRRLGYGTLRDYVIGISAIDASGRQFQAGGRVVKNVAGYDLCKLLVGSMGTLAIITQVTLKLRPIPEQTGLLWMTVDSFPEIDLLLERLTASATRPIAVEVFEKESAAQIATGGRADLPTGSPVLCLGFEGIADEVNWQLETARDECIAVGVNEIATVLGEECQPLWNAMTEFQTFQDEPLTFSANLLPSRTMAFMEAAAEQGVLAQAHAGNGIVVGHFPDEIATFDTAKPIIDALRDAAAAGHGNLIIQQCADSWKSQLPLFGDSEPSWPFMKQLKDQLDPHRILNPGLFIDGALTQQQ